MLMPLWDTSVDPLVKKAGLSTTAPPLPWIVQLARWVSALAL
jgi:hypothetical protein